MLRYFGIRLRQIAKTLHWRFMYDRHYHDGITLHIWFGVDEDCLANVIDALDLIRQLDPRSYGWIKRVLSGGIAVVERQMVAAYYLHDQRRCCLSEDMLLVSAPADIATVIVHELGHARLMHLGVGYREHQRPKVERACIRRELAFANLLDQHFGAEAGFAAEVEDRLRNLTPDFYSDEAFQQRVRRQELRRLRGLKALGAPVCLRRFAVTMVQRKRKRSHRQ